MAVVSKPFATSAGTVRTKSLYPLDSTRSLNSACRALVLHDSNFKYDINARRFLITIDIETWAVIIAIPLVPSVTISVSVSVPSASPIMVSASSVTISTTVIAVRTDPHG